MTFLHLRNLQAIDLMSIVKMFENFTKIPANKGKHCILQQRCAAEPSRPNIRCNI